MQEINADSFNAISDPRTKGAYLVKFTADWCSSCKKLEPILDALDSEDDRFTAVSINADDNPGIANQYGVMSLPTLFLFKDGEPVWQKVGAVGKAVLRSELDKVL